MIRTDYIWLDMIDIIETNLIVATCVQSNQISSDLINPAPGLQKYSSERAVGQNPLKHLKHSETLLPWSTLQKTHRFWCFPKWSLGRSPSKKRDAWVHFPGLRIVCLFRFNEARRAPKWPQWSKWGISKDCNSSQGATQTWILRQSGRLGRCAKGHQSGPKLRKFNDAFRQTVCSF